MDVEKNAQVDMHKIIDAVELALLEVFEPVDAPLIHRFTPNLYTREIFMQAGSRVVSKIHKTEHQFIVSQGICYVYNIVDKGWEKIVAPYHGITPAGTRRILVIEKDTVWTTIHFINEGETLEEIEDRIIEKHENTLLTNIKTENLCLGEQ